METVKPLPVDTDPAARRANHPDRQHRLAHNSDATDPASADRRRRMTLEGLADVDAGRVVDDEAIQAWADSLGTDHELPVPVPF